MKRFLWVDNYQPRLVIHAKDHNQAQKFAIQRIMSGDTEDLTVGKASLPDAMNLFEKHSYLHELTDLEHVILQDSVCDDCDGFRLDDNGLIYSLSMEDIKVFAKEHFKLDLKRNSQRR